MRMFPLESEEEVKSFPLTKWKIPEPSKELVLSREDGVLAGDIDVVVVPGMAFDASCNRLGHGKGYYGERTASLFIVLAILECTRALSIYPLFTAKQRSRARTLQCSHRLEVRSQSLSSWPVLTTLLKTKFQEIKIKIGT